MANQSRSYTAPGLELGTLVSALEGWLTSQDFRFQALKTDDGNTLVQIEQAAGWRKITGMSTALNIVLNQSGDQLNVEIGAGQWLDKVAGGTVGMLLLWPLAVTTAIGTWNQSQMPTKVFQYIGNFLNQRQQAPAKASTSEDDLISKLERLSALRDKGILTDEEFQAQKAKILAEG